MAPRFVIPGPVQGVAMGVNRSALGGTPYCPAPNTEAVTGKASHAEKRA
jgi:hypothetical protein